MEEETSNTNDEESNEGDEEDSIMAMTEAVPDASLRQVHDYEIGECVDDLSGIFGCIVVLLIVSA